jgi:hypothetical protein
MRQKSRFEYYQCRIVAYTVPVPEEGREQLTTGVVIPTERVTRNDSKPAYAAGISCHDKYLVSLH